MGESFSNDCPPIGHDGVQFRLKFSRWHPSSSLLSSSETIESVINASSDKFGKLVFFTYWSSKHLSSCEKFLP
jgi:hypothetical protein